MMEDVFVNAMEYRGIESVSNEAMDDERKQEHKGLMAQKDDRLSGQPAFVALCAREFTRRVP